ncbi:MAG: cobalt-precorrin-5B (C(1))-methyltransferase CbiD [Treponemataceae bacterium]|nr:cobalt-precorrin-5B (C(1))-methyltransferase CbiD [Treponemataceae bacterium]
MRLGFTTGSCAAAASKAAVYMLLTGKEKSRISITTPKGIVFDAELVDISRSETEVSCAVIKDGGDDPDVTTGAHIFSTVSLLPEKGEAYVEIVGGIGVGVVTAPGLDQKVGEAAINHVPRDMIKKEVLELCSLCDYKGGIRVEISVPEGEALASKTFNPRLGIKGGISILGTSGIVEPMSSQALLDTIRVELRQKKALGYSVAAVSPGNYGLDFMKESFGYDLDKSVKCSNFIGDTIDMAYELGFRKMLITGHIGKLIKVSGGIMNTHSREGDCRMELLAAAAVKNGASLDVVSKILDATVTEEGIRLIEEDGRRQETMDYILERILFFLEKRAGEGMEIGCILYSKMFGLLSKSRNADQLLAEAKEQGR